MYLLIETLSLYPTSLRLQNRTVRPTRKTNLWSNRHRPLTQSLTVSLTLICRIYTSHCIFESVYWVDSHVRNQLCYRRYLTHHTIGLNTHARAQTFKLRKRRMHYVLIINLIRTLIGPILCIYSLTFRRYCTLPKSVMRVHYYNVCGCSFPPQRLEMCRKLWLITVSLIVSIITLIVLFRGLKLRFGIRFGCIINIIMICSSLFYNVGLFNNCYVM